MERQVYLLKRKGSLKNLRLTRESIAAPGLAEVTVAVKAIGLNFADIFAILGLYSAAPKDPFVPGLEYSGEIVAIGSAVQGLHIGQRVMGVTRFGGYATSLNIDARYVSPIPEGWTLEEAAAYPVQVLTAYYALVYLGNLQPGQQVLIQSGAGGVGILANRIAKALGAQTIGVVGSEAKFSVLKKEGYDAWLVRDNDFKRKVNEALKGKTLDLVLEATGGRFLQWSYDLLAPQGRMVCYGSASFTPAGKQTKPTHTFVEVPDAPQTRSPTDDHRQQIRHGFQPDLALRESRIAGAASSGD